MKLPPLCVMPFALVKGFRGEPSLEDPEIGLYPVHTATEALEGIHATDAHTVAYLVPGEEAQPRLNKSSLPFFQAQCAEPLAHWVFVDVDLPGHAKWETMEDPDGFWEDVLALLQKIPEWSSAGWYITRGGYRLIWPLAEPLPVSIYEAWAKDFRAYLRNYGVPCDELPDWTRLYRLPRVRRDGKNTDLPLDFSTMAPLRWSRRQLQPGTPAAVVRSGRMAAIRPGEWGDSLPEYEEPTESEWRKIRAGTEYFEKLKAGEPLEPPPESKEPRERGRDQAMIRVIGQLCNLLELADPVLVYRYMYRSIANDPFPGGPDPVKLWERCKIFADAALEAKLGIQPVRAGLQRAADKIRAERATLTDGQPLAADDDPPDEETDDVPSSASVEAAAVAEVLEGIEAKTARFAGDLHRRLILTDTQGKAFWVYDQKRESYRGPINSKLICNYLELYCLDLAGTTRSKNGSPKSVERYLSDSGKVVSQVLLIAGQEETIYDPEQDLLLCGCASFRDMEPEYNPQIDQWLRHLGGEHTEDLLDWIATLRKIERPTCALYIHAPRGVGKELLALGLAGLWKSQTFVRYETLTSAFNDSLSRSLLVWADETIPRGFNGAAPSAVFRQVIASSQHKISQKFLPEMTLLGCPRMLITANNDKALAVEEEDLTPEDLEAIIQRVGYIRTDHTAREYLESIGGRETTEAWVAGGGVARHALWLEQNRSVPCGPRFLVQGWRTVMHDSLLSKAGINQLVLTAIAKYLSEPQFRNEGFRTGNGHLWINGPALREQWKHFLGADSKTPQEWAISSALSALSDPWNPEGDRKRSFWVNNANLNFWNIRWIEVVRISEALQIGDPAAMRAKISAVLPERAGTVRTLNPAAVKS